MIEIEPAIDKAVDHRAIIRLDHAGRSVRDEATVAIITLDRD